MATCSLFGAKLCLLNSIACPSRLRSGSLICDQSSGSDKRSYLHLGSPLDAGIHLIRVVFLGVTWDLIQEVKLWVWSNSLHTHVRCHDLKLDSFPASACLLSIVWSIIYLEFWLRPEEDRLWWCIRTEQCVFINPTGNIVKWNLAWYSCILACLHDWIWPAPGKSIQERDYMNHRRLKFCWFVPYIVFLIPVLFC